MKYQGIKIIIIVFTAGLSRVVFAAYNNLDRWLQPRDTNQSSGKPLVNTGSRYRVRSRVVSASINEPSGHSGNTKRLTDPVEFVLHHSNVSIHYINYTEGHTDPRAVIISQGHKSRSTLPNFNQFYGFAVTHSYQVYVCLSV